MKDQGKGLEEPGLPSKANFHQTSLSLRLLQVFDWSSEGDDDCGGTVYDAASGNYSSGRTDQRTAIITLSPELKSTEHS